MVGRTTGSAALLFALSCAGCGFGGIDFSAKTCPCGEGFECDEVCDRCVPSGGGGLITISDLGAEWTTPNGIRWSWLAQGRPEDLARYELIVGETQQAVCQGRDVRVWGPDDNPELARFFLPDSASADPVTRTLTDEHQSDRPYFARLRAIDTRSRVSLSNVASTRTLGQPQVGALEVYSESDIGSAPQCLSPSSTAPFQGSKHYQVTPACPNEGDGNCAGPNNAASCWMNLSLEKNIDLTTWDAGSFETAYLEFAIAYDATAPAYWAEAHLKRDQAVWSVRALTLRADGAYRLYQVRLNSLIHSSERPIELADLAQPFDAFWLGGRWQAGSTVRIDEVRLYR